MATQAPAWQVALAAVLTVATIGAAIRLAARIYINSVLRTGGRIGWGEALRGRGD
jgi:ABC-2 type transport system permease protein